MFQHNWRRWISTALLAISSMLAAAAPAAELTTIRIAHNGFSSEMPVYVGKDAGIYTKHGFNVEPIFILGMASMSSRFSSSAARRRSRR